MKNLSFFNNSAQVYVIESDDFIKPNSIDLDDYISVLSEEEKDRFNRYKNEKAKFTFLTARVYLRLLLSEIITEQNNYIAITSNPNDNCSNKCWQIDARPSILRTRLAPSEIIRRQRFSETAEENKVEQDSCQLLIIATTPSGKPYLKDHPNLFFNLSHTDNLILIAIANSPVGVDVEKNERNADKEAIIKHFFSDREQHSFFSQPENQRQLAFVKGWTRKEAILKATGEGLSAMKKYEVSFEPVTDYPLLNKEEYNSFKISDFTPNDGYAACLALFTTSC